MIIILISLNSDLYNTFKNNKLEDNGKKNYSSG